MTFLSWKIQAQILLDKMGLLEIVPCSFCWNLAHI